MDGHDRYADQNQDTIGHQSPSQPSGVDLLVLGLEFVVSALHRHANPLRRFCVTDALSVDAGGRFIVFAKCGRKILFRATYGSFAGCPRSGSARCRDRVRLPRMIWITGMRQVSPFAKFAILYTALYSAFGVVSPFLPAFLGDRSLTAEQIAAVIGSATAVRLVSGPLVGRLADRQRLWRGLLAGCISGAGVVVPSMCPPMVSGHFCW